LPRCDGGEFGGEGAAGDADVALGLEAEPPAFGEAEVAVEAQAGVDGNGSFAGEDGVMRVSGTPMSLARR
jgi:hypothetical protein